MFLSPFNVYDFLYYVCCLRSLLPTHHFVNLCFCCFSLFVTFNVFVSSVLVNQSFVKAPFFSRRHLLSKHNIWSFWSFLKNRLRYIGSTNIPLGIYYSKNSVIICQGRLCIWLLYRLINAAK